MCGICGLLDDGPQWSDMPDRRPQRQRRLEQMALLNRLLAPTRCKLSDFHGSWLLCGPTGQQAMIASLSQLWSAIDAMGGRLLDPLDERWLAAVAGDGDGAAL